jgi:hypothetical protein
MGGRTGRIAGSDGGAQRRRPQGEGQDGPSHIEPPGAGSATDPNGRLGGQGRNRTTDTVIFSHVLYQLSYLAVGGRRVLDPRHGGAVKAGGTAKDFDRRGGRDYPQAPPDDPISDP